MEPLVGKYEQLINGVWVDLSSRASWGDAGSPVEISRGLNDDGSPLAGTMTVTLENSDGALTPGGPGPWGPHLVRWRPARVSVLVDGVWRQRFYGFVNAQPLSWPTGRPEYCVVTVTAIDIMARLAAESLHGISAEMVLATHPIAYWPLTDSGEPAANLSGETFAELAETKVGEGGEVSWGGGVPLPSDSSGGVVLKMRDLDNWSYLRSTATLPLPATWAISVHFTPTYDSAGYGTVIEVGDDNRQVAIVWDPDDRKCRAFVRGIDAATGDSYSWLVGTSASAQPAGGAVIRETLTGTSSGTYKLGSAASSVTIVDPWSIDAKPSTLPSVVRVEVGDATAGWPGEVKHLAIWSGALPSLPATLMPSASTVQSWVQQLIDWAGVSATATTRGTNRTTVTPAVDGASPVGVMGSLAAGSLARVAVDAAGNPVITSWDYLPTPITGPSGEIDPDVEWVADPDGSPTMVTMTWPDGKVYRAIRSGERPTELPGVLPYAIGASVAEWVIQSGSDAPRISEAIYDLATLPVAAAVSLSVLEVGDRLTIDMLPLQLPAVPGSTYPWQTSIIDAITETIGADQWTIAFRTSPETRDRAFIAGDAVKGKVGAGYLAGPFGPDATGAWRAGEEITAARLNARQYPGGQIQAGRVSITPSAANVDTSLAVSFPTSFAVAPKVVVTADTSVPYSEVRSVTVSDISTTGFTLWINRTNTAATPVEWLAAS